MQKQTTNYFDLLERIKHCTCLLRFLAMLDDNTSYADAIEALEIVYDHHTKLTKYHIAHPLHQP